MQWYLFDVNKKKLTLDILLTVNPYLTLSVYLADIFLEVHK